MKTLNKYSRSEHFCLVPKTYMWWRHHNYKLSDHRARLHFRVGWFGRKSLVEFLLHQTTHHSHVLRAVNMKSQFDIYFTSRKTKLNKTSLYMP